MNFLPKIALLILLHFLIYGCSNPDSSAIQEHINKLKNLTVYSADAEPDYQIQLEREQVFGDTEEAVIGRISDFAVDENGHVYLADADQLDVKVYSPDGHFIDRLGRSGEGPGEFLELSDIQTNQNRILVFDHNQQQVVVFTTDSLSYSRTISLAGNRTDFQELRGSFLSKFYPRGDGSFLMLFTGSYTAEGVRDWDKIENRTLMYLLEESGNINSEKLFERTLSYQVLIPFGGRSVGMPVDFYGSLLTVQSKNEQIYIAWSEDFLIKKYSPAGEYLEAFYYSIPRVSLDTENAFPKADPEIIREAARSAEIPETSPVLDNMFIDDENRLWISTIVEDFDEYEWWVLEETGELITKFKWPRDERIEVIKNGKMYTRQTDEESGLQQVVRYRVEIK